MFRAQQNVFDDVVAKATDENLTSENWEYILDVCDKVAAEDTGAKDAVSSMIKRLGHRNANVQLYTLELANALSQNCGAKIHRELASRSFTDAMLRLANDRNTHQQVKTKILERMEEWTEMFSSNPDFGIMEQAYMKLKSTNPNLHPPPQPAKQQITEVDRRKEEEELQMALALSLKDKSPAGASSSKPVEAASTPKAELPANTIQPMPSGTTAATVSRVRALYDFQPSEPGELQFRKGDIIAVLESVYKDWWKGSLRGQTGIFPLNYVEKLQDPTQAELQREAQMEAEVFAEIKNVEKLLTLLSTSSADLNVRDNEEISSLYSSTVAIRPKLIELIGKYSQKKDDFTQLNEKFIKARRDYEALLESSMAQPPQPNWGRPGPSQPSYAYPSSGGPSQGYPQDPQRFYSPRPQDQDPSAPPRNGPAPFYVVGQQQPPYPPTSGPQVDPRGRTPSGSRPSDPYTQHQRPKSTYETPQELSAYASPIDTRPKSQSPELRHSYLPQAQQAPPPQAQKPAQVPEQTPEQAPGQQPLAQAEPPQPSHQPPSVPSPGPLGLTQHSAYPVLGTQGAGGYQAYSRPQYAPPRAQATQGDGSDFYR